MAACTWEVEPSCCDDDWSAHPPEVQERAVTLAAATLNMLTGFRAYNCPVTIRPCRADCPAWPTYLTWPVRLTGSFPTGAFVPGPAIIGGEWFNIGCGCAQVDCGCTQVCEIRMPGEVAAIEEVVQDGVTVDPDAYRVDNGVRLVRTDADCWPLCQRMDLAPTEEGTFAVTYRPGVDPGVLGDEALGTLACEFAKACVGGKCRLPGNITAITRQGVSISLDAEVWPGGLTGLREADSLILRLNPNHLTSPSLVWSPARRMPRFQTWP